MTPSFVVDYFTVLSCRRGSSGVLVQTTSNTNKDTRTERRVRETEYSPQGVFDRDSVPKSTLTKYFLLPSSLTLSISYMRILFPQHLRFYPSLFPRFVPRLTTSWSTSDSVSPRDLTLNVESQTDDLLSLGSGL